MRLESRAATHRVSDGQAIPLALFVPSMSRTADRVGGLAAGFVATTARPWLEPATQNAALGQPIAKRTLPGVDAVDHVGVAAAGLVVDATTPPPPATHRDVDGHDTERSAGPLTLTEFHVGVAAVGLVVAMALALPSTATHSDVDGQETP
jgi:hypothetical protein